jgi:hypothetical protein
MPVKVEVHRCYAVCERFRQSQIVILTLRVRRHKAVRCSHELRRRDGPEGFQGKSS